ncbi:MAG: TetR/AcrR family transcriptional regulator [Thaumarchaeota archaeon]|nr:TetR/AcrR family transcriptional regulator [Nitrososphaerota archaeon]
MRDPEKTRAQILSAAFDTIYRNGFRASSVKEIVSKAGVTEGAFFHYFHTKDDLGYALADEVLKEMMLDRWTRPLAAYENPVQGMIVRFRKLMESTSDEDLSLGCPLNNLTQEMSPVDQAFRDKLREVLGLWVDETERYLKKAQARGYLKPGVNPRQVAEFAVMAEEGSAAMVKNLGDRRLYWSLYESFRAYMLSISSKPNLVH